MKSVLTALVTLMMSALVIFSGVVSAQASTSDGTGFVSVSRSPIMDRAEMFSPAEETALTNAIVANHEKYGLFFAIETVSTLDGQQLEAVALAHAQALGIGEAGKDNGVFIFLSRDDRKIRFELGSGVTDEVTDAEMTRIIDSHVSPRFKEDNYPAGIEAGMVAVGEDYAGNVSITPKDGTFSVVGLLWVILALPVLYLLGRILYTAFGSKPRQRRRKDRERKDSYSRLGKLTSFGKQLKYAPELSEYKALPDEVARLAWLRKNHPDIAETLKAHYSSETPTTNIIDRYFYLDTNTFFSDYSGKSSTDSSVKLYKLTGQGFENIAIDEANNRIQAQKDKYLKGLAKQRKRKERAKKIWNAIPEPTQKALKKAKTESDRVAILAQGGASEFAANYALIASMFLSNDSYSSGSSSSGRSSSSSSSRSSSSSSSSSYDSGSYGGGSFDGGGGSGGW